MKLEDHKGYVPACSVAWAPLFTFKGHLFADYSSSHGGLVVHDPEGSYRGTIFPFDARPIRPIWFDETFTAEDQQTIWALAQLHR